MNATLEEIGFILIQAGLSRAEQRSSGARKAQVCHHQQKMDPGWWWINDEELNRSVCTWRAHVFLNSCRFLLSKTEGGSCCWWWCYHVYSGKWGTVFVPLLWWDSLFSNQSFCSSVTPPESARHTYQQANLMCIYLMRRPGWSNCELLKSVCKATSCPADGLRMYGRQRAVLTVGLISELETLWTSTADERRTEPRRFTCHTSHSPLGS